VNNFTEYLKYERKVSKRKITNKEFWIATDNTTPTPIDFE